MAPKMVLQLVFAKKLENFLKKTNRQKFGVDVYGK